MQPRELAYASYRASAIFRLRHDLAATFAQPGLPCNVIDPGVIALTGRLRVTVRSALSICDLCMFCSFRPCKPFEPGCRIRRNRIVSNLFRASPAFASTTQRNAVQHTTSQRSTRHIERHRDKRTHKDTLRDCHRETHRDTQRHTGIQTRRRTNAAAQSGTRRHTDTRRHTETVRDTLRRTHTDATQHNTTQQNATQRNAAHHNTAHRDAAHATRNTTGALRTLKDIPTHQHRTPNSPTAHTALTTHALKAHERTAATTTTTTTTDAQQTRSMQHATAQRMTRAAQTSTTHPTQHPPNTEGTKVASPEASLLFVLRKIAHKSITTTTAAMTSTTTAAITWTCAKD